jgi:hypothetical protein
VKIISLSQNMRISAVKFFLYITLGKGRGASCGEGALYVKGLPSSFSGLKLIDILSLCRNEDTVTR